MLISAPSKEEINNLKESFSMLLNLTEKMLEEPTKSEVVKRPSSFKALKKNKMPCVCESIRYDMTVVLTKRKTR